MVERKARIGTAVIALIMLILNYLVPYLPGDDIIWHYKLEGNGKIHDLKDALFSSLIHIETINGRFVPHLILRVLALDNSGIIHATLNTLTLFGMLFFISKIIYSKSLSKTITFSQLFFFTVFIFIIGNPELGETTLWFSGSLNYLWGHFFAFVLIYFLTIRQKRDFLYFLSPLLALLVGSFTENVSISVLFYLGYFLFRLLQENKTKTTQSIISATTFILLAFSIYITITSGGNEDRSSTLASGQDYYWIFGFLIRVIKYLLIYFWAIWILITIDLLINRKQKGILNHTVQDILKSPFTYLGLISLFVMIGAKGYMPTRTTTFSWTCLLITFITILARNGTLSMFYGQYKRIFMLFYILALGIVFSSTLYYYYNMRQIEVSRFANKIFTPHISWRGPLFFIRDFKFDQKTDTLLNTKYNDYYGHDTIFLHNNLKANIE